MTDQTVQLNLATSAGAKFHTDEVVISTATAQVQRIKIGVGTDSVYTEVSTTNPMPVQLYAGTATAATFYVGAGTATMGTVALQADAAVALNGGTATIGNVILSTGGAVFLKTPTGGNIPADTTSGIMVKFGLPQTVNIQTTSGIPAVGLSSEGSVTIPNPVIIGGRYDPGGRTLVSGAIGAFAVDVNGHVITSPHAESLALSDAVSNTVNIESDHVGGFIAKGALNFFFNGTSWDRVRGSTGDGLLVNLGANNDVVIGAGTATMGTVNLPTTQVVIPHIIPSVATDTWGPKTTNVTTSGTNALATAPGTNTSIYVTAVKAVNRATDVGLGGLSDGTVRDRGSLAANGGGWVMQYNPPWKLPGNTALSWVATAAGNIDVTVHFYTGAT